MIDIPKKVVLKLIRFYQRTLSLDHGYMSRIYSEGWCRFRPTCSEYTYCAIEKYGLIKGVFLGFWRVNRCNPWSKGGVDDVPTNKEKTKKFILYGFLTLLGYIIFMFLLALLLSKIFK